jgi:hypothetical protein
LALVLFSERQKKLKKMVFSLLSPMLHQRRKSLFGEKENFY